MGDEVSPRTHEDAIGFDRPLRPAVSKTKAEGAAQRLGDDLGGLIVELRDGTGTGQQAMCRNKRLCIGLRFQRGPLWQRGEQAISQGFKDGGSILIA
ncbi:hypothetical protein D9M72_631420 [compost metagenome]